jgi:hypothetical protein
MIKKNIRMEWGERKPDDLSFPLSKGILPLKKRPLKRGLFIAEIGMKSNILIKTLAYKKSGYP